MLALGLGSGACPDVPVLQVLLFPAMKPEEMGTKAAAQDEARNGIEGLSIVSASPSIGSSLCLLGCSDHSWQLPTNEFTPCMPFSPCYFCWGRCCCCCCRCRRRPGPPPQPPTDRPTLPPVCPGAPTWGWCLCSPTHRLAADKGCFTRPPAACWTLPACRLPPERGPSVAGAGAGAPS